jgi:ankyrin repeat protein
LGVGSWERKPFGEDDESILAATALTSANGSTSARAAPQRNADIDAVDDAPEQNSPLLIAASRGHLVVVSQLLALGADPNLHRLCDGATPLYVAAEVSGMRFF